MANKNYKGFEISKDTETGFYVLTDCTGEERLNVGNFHTIIDAKHYVDSITNGPSVHEILHTMQSDKMDISTSRQSRALFIDTDGKCCITMVIDRSLFDKLTSNGKSYKTFLFVANERQYDDVCTNLLCCDEDDEEFINWCKGHGVVNNTQDTESDDFEKFAEQNGLITAPLQIFKLQWNLPRLLVNAVVSAMNTTHAEVLLKKKLIELHPILAQEIEANYPVNLSLYKSAGGEVLELITME